jgi:hypothetical protein
VDRAHRRAKDLVQSNISVLHAAAELLMEREQIDGEDLQVGAGWPPPVVWCCRGWGGRGPEGGPLVQGASYLGPISRTLAAKLRQRST